MSCQINLIQIVKAKYYYTEISLIPLIATRSCEASAAGLYNFKLSLIKLSQFLPPHRLFILHVLVGAEDDIIEEAVDEQEDEKHSGGGAEQNSKGLNEEI